MIFWDMIKTIIGIFFFLYSIVFVSSTYAQEAEIGKGKAISASSQVAADFPPVNANDGNQNTYWEASPHAWPQTLTIDLGTPHEIRRIVLKLPSRWGIRNQEITILGSTDNRTYSVIVPFASYPMGESDATVTFAPTTRRYVRLQIYSNSVATAAQISEFQIFGSGSTDGAITPTAAFTPISSPSPTLTVSPSPTLTPATTPTPTASPPAVTHGNWVIKSVDVMKYSKDAVCTPPTDAFIKTQVTKAKELGANYVAISTPYDNPACGNSLTLTRRWVDAIRAQGLNVWHRHMGLSFEGLYGVTKKYNDDYLQLISNYIISNPTLFREGDIFTPTPEPDTAGIGGVTACISVCAFRDNAEFNQWIRNAQLVSKLSFAQIGLRNMKVGYYGTSGFIVFGENNRDWFGRSFLEQKTVEAMDNIIVMDSYPESYGGTMGKTLDDARRVWPNATFIIGEWGTITATSPQQASEQIKNTMEAAKRPYVIGFNYWNLGPSGNEGLLNNDLSNKPTFFDVQSFFTD